MGVGHVPPRQVRVVGARGDVQGRQRRGASSRDRLAVGRSGEDAAAAWYVAAGYEVIDRNWRCREGELDLVLRRGRLVVFCEVKTRSSLAFGAPVEAVTRTKQQRLRRLALRWLDSASFRPGEIRFDVASVLDGVIEVEMGAF